jgi:hypothetical protein
MKENICIVYLVHCFDQLNPFFYIESHQDISISSTRIFDNHSGFVFTILIIIILLKLIPVGAELHTELKKFAFRFYKILSMNLNRIKIVNQSKTS